MSQEKFNLVAVIAVCGAIAFAIGLARSVDLSADEAPRGDLRDGETTKPSGKPAEVVTMAERVKSYEARCDQYANWLKDGNRSVPTDYVQAWDQFETWYRAGGFRDPRARDGVLDRYPAQRAVAKWHRKQARTAEKYGTEERREN